MDTKDPDYWMREIGEVISHLSFSKHPKRPSGGYVEDCVLPVTVEGVEIGSLTFSKYSAGAATGVNRIDTLLEMFEDYQCPRDKVDSKESWATYLHQLESRHTTSKSRLALSRVDIIDGHVRPKEAVWVHHMDDFRPEMIKVLDLYRAIVTVNLDPSLLSHEYDATFRIYKS